MALINYNKGSGNLKNWLVEEPSFNAAFLRKWEAIFCQGNGYLGLRAALEEKYVGEMRNLLITGTFNKFDGNEVTEIPNVPDITEMEFEIEGKSFTLMQGNIYHYSRYINLKNGEIHRTFEWESIEGKRIGFHFRRFVSMDNDHIIANAVELTPLSDDMDIKITSGINGRVSNSGSQHFSEGERRIYDHTYLEMLSSTTQSKVTAAIHTAHRFTIDGEKVSPDILPIIERRQIKISTRIHVPKNSTLAIEKISTVHSTRDLEYADLEQQAAVESLKNNSLAETMKAYELGYNQLFSSSEKKWEAIWNRQDILIESQNEFDQLAIRFAIYHLNIMVKKDDNRVGIGAKGMSGEGYKGHSFWDTEVFILPYFMLVEPQTARTLLEYRYKGLYGAREKARAAGFEGAMYPWESAWIDDGEVTPLWGNADVVTGETLKIWTGALEIHITADIAFAVWQYYITTMDEEFMDKFGYEIILETARFWISRFEWNQEYGRYEITDIIGPDEYKEHVHNNAYTNYMAHYNMKLAAKLIGSIREGKRPIYSCLNEKFKLDSLEEKINSMLHKIYLPEADSETAIIPQFDGYFGLKSIDLRKYKESSAVGTIYNDYNMEQINGFQVLKQSDLVILFFLLSDLFDEEIRRKNYLYYEERTLHDSSLSKSTHSVIANDLGMCRTAYDFFQGASKVDLGEEMKSSDYGIHSASMGGIWQAVVMGFGGVRIVGGQLRIAPSLPAAWNQLSFSIVWRSSPLNITVTGDKAEIENLGQEVSFWLGEKWITLGRNERHSNKGVRTNGQGGYNSGEAIQGCYF